MDEDTQTTSSRHDWRELVAVVLLSITTILTAWSGFQASKWGGAMSISFSQASSARIEASRDDGDANRRQTIQVALYTQWLEATATNNTRLQSYLSARFPEPLKTAFTAWIATNPKTNPQAPASPFSMPEYKVPELAAASAADARADAKFAEALDYNQRGDNYTLLTVAFASVLFFAAMSGRMQGRRAQWFLLGVGLVMFLGAVSLLLVYPKLV
ncbi:MAG TPA: hypothetical protein VIC82_11035 [Candidatus Nanopelagicales bacterium]|jgi:hypothetical protein